MDSRNNVVDVYKRAMTAYDYLGMSYYKNQFSSKFNTSSFIVGHNRKATRGGIHNSTAHPFIAGNTVMVHNGTLSNHTALPDGKDFTVDSEALAHAISKIGAKEAFEQARGSFASIWYDIDTKTLGMVRNSERPLHYAFCTSHDSVLVASEPAMLMWIAFRNKIQIDKIIPLIEGEITTFTKDNLHEPTKEKIKLQAIYKQTTYNPKKYNAYNAQLPGKAKPKHAPTDNRIVDFPTNRRINSKHRRKIAKQLTGYGLKLGGKVIFESVCTTKYSKDNDVCKLEGIYGDSKYSVLIVDYSFNKEDYVENCAYTATVVGMKVGTDKEDDIIIVTGSKTLVINQQNKEVDKRTTTHHNPRHLKTTEPTTYKKPDKELMGPKGELIPREEWEKLTQDGCANCTGAISPLFHERNVFLSISTGGGVLCHECGEDWADGRLGPLH